MHERGLPGRDVSYVYLVNTPDSELELIAATGGTASVCRSVEAIMAQGPAPAARLPGCWRTVSSPISAWIPR